MGVRGTNPPVVTGISPKEATAGAKLTIRGEFLGVSEQDLLSVQILGQDCRMTVEWKSSTKLTALCPAGKECKAEIVVTTISGGVGSCTVTFRAFKEAVNPLKEVAFWPNERHFARNRKNRNFPGLEASDDALGLSVEGTESGSKFPEETLQEMFPYKSGDITHESFSPSYYLLENHYGTTFEDLKAGMQYLKRKVDGESESQVAFIKSNVGAIVDQMDTLKALKAGYEADSKTLPGGDQTLETTRSILKAQKEANGMFIDVLGRKDRADATRNGLNVMNRFRFLFLLPANIEANVNKGDYDRVIDEYDRALNLYGDSDSEIFKKYLEEAEKGVNSLKIHLQNKLEKNSNLSVESQKKIIANLIQLDYAGDPGWNLLQINHSRLYRSLNACKEEYLESPLIQTPLSTTPGSFLTGPTDMKDVSPPNNVLFVQDVLERLTEDFPDLWKLGQSYFKGDLIVAADASKSPIFKEMILGIIRYVSNLVRSAVIPHTIKKEEEKDLGGEWIFDKSGIWLPYCLRHVRNCYASFIDLDLPSVALDIIKKLTTDFRIQCLQTVFQNVTDQAYLLHEKENWKREITDYHGCITYLPEMFMSLVNESLALIKEAVMNAEDKEDDILNFKNARDDLEFLIQKVLGSFANTLETAAVADYINGSSDVPKDSTRLLLCINNCYYTRSKILPKIQKAFQEIGNLSLEGPIGEATKCYNVLDKKLFEAYMELKCEPIVSAIESRMYVGKFDWARCPKPVDARDYVKVIVHDVISVHSEVERITCQYFQVEAVMLRLVETVTEEVNRLFCSINRMNSNGCIQAWIDINCLKSALRPFLNANSEGYLDEACKPLLELERPGDSEIVQSCEDVFKKRMRYYLQAFHSNTLK